mmetsp:Transcript_14306/g.53918  ORF Transcript_14306/g.53918 Transcript_14306/m.53918 type:complete len:222 (+) Transcript_14306:2308-2973(+)
MLLGAIRRRAIRLLELHLLAFLRSRLLVPFCTIWHGGVAVFLSLHRLASPAPKVIHHPPRALLLAHLVGELASERRHAAVCNHQSVLQELQARTESLRRENRVRCAAGLLHVGQQTSEHGPGCLHPIFQLLPESFQLVQPFLGRDVAEPTRGQVLRSASMSLLAVLRRVRDLRRVILGVHVQEIHVLPGHLLGRVDGRQGHQLLQQRRHGCFCGTLAQTLL